MVSGSSPFGGRNQYLTSFVVYASHQKKVRVSSTCCHHKYPRVLVSKVHGPSRHRMPGTHRFGCSELSSVTTLKTPWVWLSCPVRQCFFVIQKVFEVERQPKNKHYAGSWQRSQRDLCHPSVYYRSNFSTVYRNRDRSVA